MARLTNSPTPAKAAKRQSSPPLSERVGFLSHKVGQLLLQTVEQKLNSISLNSRSYFVLSGIDRQVPLSQQELSRLLGIDPTTIVTLVDELEAAGYVSRSRNPLDRRRHDLLLTPEGVAALDAAHGAMDDAEREFFGSLTDAQLRDYHLMLRRIVADRWPPA